MAIYNDERIYFECIDAYKGSLNSKGFKPTERIFGIYDVPEDIWEIIDDRNKDFIKYVGNHWSFMDIDGNKILYEPRPSKSENDKFYKKWESIEIKMKLEWLILLADSGI